MAERCPPIQVNGTTMAPQPHRRFLLPDPYHRASLTAGGGISWSPSPCPALPCASGGVWGQSSDCRCCCGDLQPAGGEEGRASGPQVTVSAPSFCFSSGLVFVPSSTSKCEPSSVLTCVLVMSVFQTLSMIPLRLRVRGRPRHRVSSPSTWHEAVGFRLWRQQGLVQQTFAREGP